MNRCIECEEIQLARVADARAVQMLPLMTRRRALAAGLAGAAAVYGPRALRFDEVFDAVAEASMGPTQNCLVIVYLAGGNDVLNTLVPQAAADFSSYTAKRPALARIKGPDAAGKVGSQPLPGGAGADLGERRRDDGRRRLQRRQHLRLRHAL